VPQASLIFFTTPFLLWPVSPKTRRALMRASLCAVTVASAELSPSIHTPSMSESMASSSTRASKSCSIMKDSAPFDVYALLPRCSNVLVANFFLWLCFTKYRYMIALDAQSMTGRHAKWECHPRVNQPPSMTSTTCVPRALTRARTEAVIALEMLIMRGQTIL